MVHSKCVFRWLPDRFTPNARAFTALDSHSSNLVHPSCPARNLQRPELQWGQVYPLRDHRDVLLLDSKPMSGIVDPPLSFVHSVTARSPDGAVREIILYVEVRSFLRPYLWALQFSGK